MATTGRDVIDFPALERELQMAVESERRYQRQNEAKLRAVSQRVASYREFRDLVVSCHLKPLEKNDKDGAQRKQPWNPVVLSNK
ncbi:dynein axonemal assembly factor 19 [Echeneis naucrates]|uniref:dynein axonemal assembly factor 19 n=1 Tax=Echeneis naucrates TaxID=173247 RepID=UPI001113F473|nr:coiled-coil domain-containing protein 103 [Echeneis naucrates]